MQLSVCDAGPRPTTRLEVDYRIAMLNESNLMVALLSGVATRSFLRFDLYNDETRLLKGMQILLTWTSPCIQLLVVAWDMGRVHCQHPSLFMVT